MMSYFNKIIFIILLFMVMRLSDTLEVKNKTAKINNKIYKSKTASLLLELETYSNVFNNYFNITNSNHGINLFENVENYHGDGYGNGLVKIFNIKNGSITDKCGQIGRPCVKWEDCCSGYCPNKKCGCKLDGWTCAMNSMCCSGYCTIIITPGYTEICMGVPVPLLAYIKQFEYANISSLPCTLVNNPTNADDETTTKEQNNNNEIHPECSVNETEELYNKKKAGIPDEKYRWRRGFFVQITFEFSKSDVEIILNGLLVIYDIIDTCLPIFIWPPGSKPTNEHVIIRKAPSRICNSSIGKQSKQPQYINLGGGCVTNTIVIHEIMHALGLQHEHSRPDRDKYINIHKDNIEPMYLYTFNKQSTHLTFGTHYEYNSIMHYSSTAFNIKGKNSITKKNGGVIGYNYYMVDTDEKKIHHMYCLKE